MGIHSPGIALPGIIIGIPMFAKSSSKMVPLVGIIDTGSMFSVVNWAAAKQLGLAKGPKDSKLERATKVEGGIRREGHRKRLALGLQECRLADMRRLWPCQRCHRGLDPVRVAERFRSRRLHRSGGLDRPGRALAGAKVDLEREGQAIVA